MAAAIDQPKIGSLIMYIVHFHYVASMYLLHFADCGLSIDW